MSALSSAQSASASASARGGPLTLGSAMQTPGMSPGLSTPGGGAALNFLNTVTDHKNYAELQKYSDIRPGTY